MGNPVPAPGLRTRRPWALGFEATDTCSSSHVGTTGRAQLRPCCLWNAGNAGLRKDNNLHALMLCGHPHEACDLP